MAVDATEEAGARAEWRSGWRVPFISLVALSVAFSHIYTMGAFFAPLQDEYGWSRTAISSGLTIVSVISVICAPFVGGLVDRWGPRRMAIPGLLLFCLSYAALGFAGPGLWSWWLIWLMVGAGAVCIKPTVWAAAITTRFDRGRGLAMAVALCGSGVGGVYLPFLATHLIATAGWRQAFVTIGLAEALVVAPLVALFFVPAGKGCRTHAQARDALTGMGVREAMTSSRFVRLAAANLLITVSLLAIVVHMVPILIQHGTGKREAAAVAGLIGVSQVIGRLGTGFMLDRHDGPRIGFLVFLLPITSCLLLLLVPGGASAYLAAIVIGLAVGSEVDIVMYLASRYFGTRHFGTVYGTLGGLTSLGTGLGPLLAGIVYDRTGGYAPLLVAIIPVLAVAALLVRSLGPYPVFAAPVPRARAAEKLETAPA